MSEERLSNLEADHSELVKDVRALQQSVTKLVVSLEAHANDERNLELTLRNLDNSVNELRLQFVASPIERNREVMEVTEPIWNTVRKIDDKITECKDKVKLELRKEYKTLGTVIFLAFGVLTGMGSYIFLDMKQAMNKDHTAQSEKIEAFINGVSQ